MERYSITRYRKLLLQLGFRDRATADLEEASHDFSAPGRRMLAARELALLKLAGEGPSDLRAALDHLELELSAEADPASQRATVILICETLLRLGDAGQARDRLRRQVERDPHPDYHLGLANCEPEEADKVGRINAALHRAGLAPVTLRDGPAASPYDRLAASATAEGWAEQPLITVIMPAFNATGFIGTAIGSLLAQSWRNIELLVVDDHSTDRTSRAVGEWAERDPRVRLIRAGENGGPYVARNLALREASGTFVTCNDADDWSHPQKLALQARHLLDNPQFVANDSQQARATEGMYFYRRGQAGWYIFRNMSSFMFRREAIAEAIGFWDCVRFGADAEFIRRIDIVFGQGAAASLPTGPVSFQRQSAGSLTAHSAFGYHGFHMGARLEYARQQARFHQSAADLRYDFPQPRRAFPVPEPMWPRREAREGARRFYDVVIAADLRVSDAESWALATEIETLAAAGRRIGLVQLSRYDVEVDAPMPDRLCRLLERDGTDVIVYGEKIDCGLLLLRGPAILQDRQVYLPDIEAGRVVIVAPSPAIIDGHDAAEALHVADRQAEQYFRQRALWCAGSPWLRDRLRACRGPDGRTLAVAETCWEPILCSRRWYRPERRSGGGRGTLGYHAVAGLAADPGERHRLTSIHGKTDRFERQVLGASPMTAAAARSVPEGWTLAQSEELTVAAFLAQLDIFLCYDPRLGADAVRLLAHEAMAAGVPVVLDPTWREELGDAAAYARPEHALALAFHLLDTPEDYDRQRRDGRARIATKLGPEAYLDRLDRLAGRRAGPIGARMSGKPVTAGEDRCGKR
ncbi:MAG: glycosyl transferase family [Cereibacter sp.]|nr:glycosyl transferase family [Cereibacter sp.]